MADIHSSSCIIGRVVFLVRAWDFLIGPSQMTTLKLLGQGIKLQWRAGTAEEVVDIRCNEWKLGTRGKTRVAAGPCLDNKRLSESSILAPSWQRRSEEHGSILESRRLG